MTALVILAVLVLIAAAAPRYGVDSRGGTYGRRVRPIDDLRKIGRGLSRGGARLLH